MKYILLLISIITFGFKTFPQIAISNFTYQDDNGTEQIAKKIGNQLKENLSKSFFIVSRDFSDTQGEMQVQEIRDYFKKTINVDFTPASYIIKGHISQSKDFVTLFDIKIEVVNLQTNVVSTITQNYLSESSIIQIADYIAQYIKYTVPTIYKVNSFIDKKTISINYGSDRSAMEGEELELVSSAKDEVLGDVIVDKVYSTSSNCDFNLENESVDFNEMTYRNFYIRTKIDKNKTKRYRIKLAELRSERAENVIRDKEEIEIEKETDKYRVNDWLIFTVQNFSFNSDTLKKYFDRKALTPLVFGLQINFSKANTRFFISGRFSLTSDYKEETYLSSSQIDSKLFFFQVGCGIQQKFSILDFIYPGLIFGVNYMYTSIEFQNGNQSENITQAYRGVDIDFIGNLTFRIGSFGIYGDAGYHLVPFLKSDENVDLKTTGFSLGAGISFFFM
ncbi:MAG: hypothetical protein M1480_10570 [Bacteroidetes bacterium]|nr:hypothetical protein [Bacteroidota bacterium]